MNEELKACPFCGVKPEVYDVENDGAALKLVACIKCGASTIADEGEAEVIAAWNKRV